MSDSKEERAPIEMKFTQSFGDDASSDDDLVTYTSFNHDGRFLGVGDKAGRICIFEASKSTRKVLEYQYYTEFQSHELEFDCLKSLEIEEKINMIEWPKRQCNSLFLLATNDKTIKLWKIHQKKIYLPPSDRVVGDYDIKLQRPGVDEELTTHTEKRVFANAHQYHINSISMNSDGETFISADDLRVNLWNIEISDESFNICDVKPNNLEDLTEVITSASFHPFHCHVLMYSSSRGSIQLSDLRDSALCDHHARQYKVEEDATNKSFFSEIISSISDAKFTADGRYMIARDYLTLKVWDLNMERRPLMVIPVHDYLRTQLCELYENDCIFDKFECDASHDGRRFVTGSYNNNFIVYNAADQTSITIEAEHDVPKKKTKKKGKQKKSETTSSASTSTSTTNSNSTQPPDMNSIDFQKKVLHVAWHPQEDAVAVAGLNKLYIYQSSPAKRL